MWYLRGQSHQILDNFFLVSQIKLVLTAEPLMGLTFLYFVISEMLKKICIIASMEMLINLASFTESR